MDIINVDYNQIGKRIRKVRKKKGFTQEQLAEALDVGVTHISHIETGNTIPSLKLFIGIVNFLEVSADSLLCDNLYRAKTIFADEISETINDCTEDEIRIISDVAKHLKNSLRSRRKY